MIKTISIISALGLFILISPTLALAQQSSMSNSITVNGKTTTQHFSSTDSTQCKIDKEISSLLKTLGSDTKKLNSLIGDNCF